MRLIDIKNCINNAHDEFVPQFSNVGANYYITNAQALRRGIRYLYKANFLERSDNPDNIYSIIDSSYSNSIIVNSSNFDNYRFELLKLEAAITLMHNWINQYVPDNDDEKTINIKLPEIIKVEDLIKASTLINKSLSQSVSEIGGEVRIKHLDYGSSWIIISAGTALAAKLVMALADAAFNIAKKYYGVKMMQQQYERYSMGTEMIRTVKETNEKIIAYDSRVLAEHIEKDFYPESNSERIERLRVSITEMSKLVELGGEVHPSLLTASDNSMKAPDYDSLINVMKSAGELPRNETKKSEEEEQDPTDKE